MYNFTKSTNPQIHKFKSLGIGNIYFLSSELFIYEKNDEKTQN